MMKPSQVHLDALAERIRAVEQAGCAADADAAAGAVATGWPAVDAVLGGGLAAGAVHEWGLDEGTPERFGGPGRRGGGWQPPLALLVHLARQALRGRGGRGWAVWIGGRCRVYPHGLAGERGALLARSLWVEPGLPGEAAGRLWAIDLAARCRGVAVVVADGSGLDLAATRRVQLAAEAGGTLVLLARPAGERQVLSAATTRWAVTPSVSDSRWPRWAVTLWRCKGRQRGAGQEGQQRTWLLEGKRSGQGLVVVPAEAGDRPAASAVASPGRGQQQRRRA